jgi:hypothetical protein
MYFLDETLKDKIRKAAPEQAEELISEIEDAMQMASDHGYDDGRADEHTSMVDSQNV